MHITKRSALAPVLSRSITQHAGSSRIGSLWWPLAHPVCGWMKCELRTAAAKPSAQYAHMTA